MLFHLVEPDDPHPGLDGLGVPYVQAAALWLLAVGSTVTIGQRALTVRRQSFAESP